MNSHGVLGGCACMSSHGTRFRVVCMQTRVVALQCQEKKKTACKVKRFERKWKNVHVES
jgi:hypothetical protein